MTVVEKHIPASTPAPRRGLRGVYFGYWILTGALLSQFITAGMQSYVVGGFFTPMIDDLGWSRSEITLSRTIGQFVFAFAGLYVGGMVDRHGGRWLMRGGATVLGISLFASSYISELWQWWLLNGIMLSVGSAMCGSLIVNVTLSKWFVRKRGRVVGIAAMGISFAGVALTPFATWLVDTVGWREAWQVLGVMAFVLIFPVSFLMRRAPEDHGLRPDGATFDAAPERSEADDSGRISVVDEDFTSSLTRVEAMRTRSFYLIVFAFGFGTLSIGVILIHTIPFLTDAGYGRTFASSMIAVTSLPSTISKPMWGYLIDRYDAQRLSMIGFVFSALGLFMVVLGSHTNAAITILAYTILGIGWGGMIPLQEVVWASYFGRRYLGSVRSAGLPFALILGASAPVLTSLYFDAVGNYDGALLTVAGCSLLALFLITLAKTPSRIRAEAQTGS